MTLTRKSLLFTRGILHFEKENERPPAQLVCAMSSDVTFNTPHANGVSHFEIEHNIKAQSKMNVTTITCNFYIKETYELQSKNGSHAKIM